MRAHANSRAAVPRVPLVALDRAITVRLYCVCCRLHDMHRDLYDGEVPARAMPMPFAFIHDRLDA